MPDPTNVFITYSTFTPRSSFRRKRLIRNGIKNFMIIVSSSDHGPLASPPMLEPISSPQKSPAHSSDGAAAPPPLTSAVLAMPRCNVNLVKLGEPRSHIKLLDSIPSIPIPVPPVVSPITVLPSSKTSQDDDEKSTGGVSCNEPLQLCYNV